MGPICKYCKRCKKPTANMGPICGYCKVCKKLTTIMRPICGYCNELVVSTWEPICEYYNECKMLAVIWVPYAGIAMNAKCPGPIMGPICEYCNGCKMLVFILGLVCGYYMFENGLMEYIIGNEVGIVCLKCVYCFKILQVM